MRTGRDVLYDNGRIAGVRVTAPDGTDARTVTADDYISALPVEHARPTWGPGLRAADPQSVGATRCAPTGWWASSTTCARGRRW
jgi:hypothetical protein